MSIKGRVYYRERNQDPPLFKQIIRVLSGPGRDNQDQDVIFIDKFNIDYNGFKFKRNDDFGDFGDDGEKEMDGFIKPIEDVGHKELKDFFITLFENKKYTGR